MRAELSSGCKGSRGPRFLQLPDLSAVFKQAFESLQGSLTKSRESLESPGSPGKGLLT